jgi:DNA-directed RNA polymerase specialized sigma24 family protein
MQRRWDNLAMTAEEIIRAIGGSPKDQNLALKQLLPPGERGKVFRRYLRQKGVSANGDDDDVLQEVVIKIFNNAAGFKGKDGFGDASANSWMWTIVRNCVSDYFKAKESPDQRRARELRNQLELSARDAAVKAGVEGEGKKTYPYIPPSSDNRVKPNGSLDDADWQVANADAVSEALQASSLDQSRRLIEIEREECVQAGLEDFAADFPDRAEVLSMQMEGESIESIARRGGRTVNAMKTFISQCKIKLRPYIQHCQSIGMVH